MKRYFEPIALFPKPPSEQWVHLAALPAPFCYHQALLLYPQSQDHWHVWIPDHGEATLHISEFYWRSDWN